VGSDLSAAHWLLRYSVRLREREHEATELRTFSVRPDVSAAPLLLPPAPVAAPPRRRHRRAVVGVVPVVDVEATDVDVPVFIDSYAPPAVGDPTDIDAVRVIFESARAPNVATDVDTIFRTPSFVGQSVTDRMPNVAEAEWTPLKVDVSATSPRAVFVVARDPVPSPFASVHVPDEIDVLTPTSVSDLRGTIVSRPPRVTLGLSLTPPPLPERPRLLPPPVFLEPPTPPPAREAASVSAPPAPPPEPRILALPPAELPNPWAAELASAISSEPAPTETEKASRSVRRALLRGGLMLVISAAIGVGMQTGIARARRLRAASHPPAPVATLAVVATAPPPVVSPTEGDLEIHAPAAATITVDGKVRGTGPTLSMKLAPGYHTVRVGLDKTAIVEVHRGVLAAVDLSK